MSFRAFTSRPCTAGRRLRVGRRYLSNPPKPQAYLRPLVDTNQNDEFEGVMCLVMDRKEAKNALSVQMVGVSHKSDG